MKNVQVLCVFRNTCTYKVTVTLRLLNCENVSYTDDAKEMIRTV